ncbi:MAG TPA: DUF1302 family protein [Nevskiaceae bacterium]|nr:DUF1302 family protein [Nevskiaceae bacterium]
MRIKPSCGTLLLAAGALALTQPVAAIEFTVGEEVEGVLNTTITLGAAVRMQERAAGLVGKANLDRNVCGFPNQACQGLFRDQGHPARALAAAPGLFTPNSDDGNLNYDRGDLISGVAKLTQDLTLTFGEFGFFAKTLYFYDAVNNDFEEFHPNQINSANFDQAGTNEGTLGGQVQYGPGLPTRTKRRGGELLSQAGTDLQLQDAFFYGSLPLTDDKSLTFKLGRQIVNWGESTFLVINSVNQAQPVDANNFSRVGGQVEEVFTPVAAAFASFEPFSNATIEAYYQFEWRPVLAPTPGTFFAFNDIVGTDNAVNYAHIHFGGGAEDPEGLAFPQYNPLSGVTNTALTIERLPDLDARHSGQYGAAFKYYAENLNDGTELSFYYMNYHSKLPYASFFATQASCARREGNEMGLDAYDSLSFLVACPDLPVLHPNDPENATSDAVPLDTIKLLVEYPEDLQMFGFSFNTTFGAISVQGEVAYRPDAPLQVDPEDLVFAAFGPTLTRCHDRNLPRAALGLSNEQLAAIGNTVGGLVGTINDNLPDGVLPVAIPNITPAGNGCAGTTLGVGLDAEGNQINYQPSDVDPTRPDTFDLLIGHAPGSARAFPAFVTAYRGTPVGENTPCAPEFLGSRQSANPVRNPNAERYTTSSPCYIRGYEFFDTFQFNIGGTYVAGATDTFNVIGADQIISIFEIGATWVPDLPPLDQLQIEGPGTFTHASAGADGTGADGSRQACSLNPTCVANVDANGDGDFNDPGDINSDGLRFNPTQQALDGYVDKFSWGYVLINLIRYESVLPGISLAPLLIWKHDINGTAPGPGENFIAGRKQLSTLLETRYKSNLSFNVGYTWFTGGGPYNLLRDRDFAQAFVKLQF